MIASVLCGGASSRMGFDKGMILLNTIPWAMIAYNNLVKLGLEVVISIHKGQELSYLHHFPAKSLLIDDNTLNVGGPLKGLLSVHRRFPNEDVLLLACDMPNMKVEVLNFLLTRHNENFRQYNPTKERFDATVFEDNGNIEPLCAIYAKSGLKKIEKLLVEKGLEKHSMHFVLQRLSVQKIDISIDWKTCFLNCNSPKELEELNAKR